MFHFGENVLSSCIALRLSGNRRVSATQPPPSPYPGRPGVTQLVQLWPSWIRECVKEVGKGAWGQALLWVWLNKLLATLPWWSCVSWRWLLLKLTKVNAFPKCFCFVLFSFLFPFLALICDYPFLTGHDRKPKVVAFSRLHLCNFKLLLLLYSCKRIFNSQDRLWLSLKRVRYVKWACFRFSVIFGFGKLAPWRSCKMLGVWTVVIYSTSEYLSNYAPFWIFATSWEYCKFQILFVLSQGAKLWHILSFNSMSS